MNPTILSYITLLFGFGVQGFWHRVSGWDCLGRVRSQLVHSDHHNCRRAQVWDSSYGDAKYEDINILAAAERALSKKPLVFVAPTHTFFLEEFEGVLHAIICVQYKERQTDNNFGGVFLDAFIVLNLEDGRTLRKTADGEDYFSIYDSLGTFSSESSETIYKIPFKNVSNKTRNRDNPAFTQQWHLNGVTRFIAGDTAVLAFTTYFLNAAVLLKDPMK